MKIPLMIAAIATYAPSMELLAQIPGLNDLSNPWLSAGGMGILGYLLARQIKINQDSLCGIAEKHRDGLLALSKEIHDMRQDLRKDLVENRSLLSHALGLGEFKLCEKSLTCPNFTRVEPVINGKEEA
jgi:hypothetical protein